METVPEVKSAIELAEEMEPKTEEAVADPRDAKEYTFDFRYEDSRGQAWSGKFTNRILTIKQRRAVKILKGQMAGGVSTAAIDADIWELNEMIAHLMVSLDRGAPDYPAWAKDFDALHDERVIYALYEEVASHEARFYRRDAASKGSEGAD